MSIGFSNGVVQLRLATTSARLLSTGASTTSPEEDEKVHQRMKDEETTYENDIKTRILDAALGHVDENGWNKETLAIGAEAVGYPGVAHGLFPKGGVELVHHFYRQCNFKLSSELENEIKEAQLDPSKKKKTFKFVRDAVEMRLRMNEQHIITGRWIEAMGLMALPPNIPTSLRHFSGLVDDIWYYAGDTSADFSWYTKRATLGAIYKSTELCMIQDKTENFENTWEFLDRRMNDVAKINQTSRRFKESAVVMSGLCRTAMNIVGIDNNKRR